MLRGSPVSMCVTNSALGYHNNQQGCESCEHIGVWKIGWGKSINASVGSCALSDFDVPSPLSDAPNPEYPL
eukprot:749567-Pyramimonas_sp.AAC.1